MFDSPGKAQFLMKPHTKHRKDINFQGIQNVYLGFIIVCDFAPKNLENNSSWKNYYKIQTFKALKNVIYVKQLACANQSNKFKIDTSILDSQN